MIRGGKPMEGVWVSLGLRPGEILLARRGQKDDDTAPTPGRQPHPQPHAERGEPGGPQGAKPNKTKRREHPGGRTEGSLGRGESQANNNKTTMKNNNNNKQNTTNNNTTKDNTKTTKQGDPARKTRARWQPGGKANKKE